MKLGANEKPRWLGAMDAGQWTACNRFARDGIAHDGTREDGSASRWTS